MNATAPGAVTPTAEYLLKARGVALSAAELTNVKRCIPAHDPAKRLQYHALPLAPVRRLNWVTDLRRFALDMGLKLAGLSAFTAAPGVLSSIHIDGDDAQHGVPWRLNFYAEGEPAVMTWYAPGPVSYHPGSGSLTCAATVPLHSELLSMPAAIVRVNRPHRIDASGSPSPRLTLSATFTPWLPWDAMVPRARAAGYA